MRAYGACAYLVTENDSSLITAKNRVAPLRGVTILMGAVIGARLSQFIQTNIGIKFTAVYMWTDSQIVLSWLKSTKQLPTFVKNRIQEIKINTNTCTWNYCPTSSNPADLLSFIFQIWPSKMNVTYGLKDHHGLQTAINGRME